MKVAVLGASNKPDRYSYIAVSRLKAAGHEVYPVHPLHQQIQGLKVFPSLSALPEGIDTVTLYVGAQRSSALAEEILSIRPRRLIFNPGAENKELKARAEREGVQGVEACTLVLLSIGRF